MVESCLNSVRVGKGRISRMARDQEKLNDIINLSLLEDLLTEGEGDLRIAATCALTRTGSPSSVPYLLEAFKTRKLLSAGW